MAGSEMPLEELLKHLQLLAENALSLWELPAGASVRLINVSENATYLVEAPGGYKAVGCIGRTITHAAPSNASSPGSTHSAPGRW